MLDIESGKIVSDKKIAFYDGFLWIISANSNPSWEDTASCELIILDPEFDAPIFLSEIAEKYPDVKKVLFEGPLDGVVYTYNNHTGTEEKWELVGKTLGYA